MEIEYVDIRANSEPQLEFLENAPFNDETFYGGAAGPGKTWALVVLPVYHGFTEYSGFRGQIFRESIPQLREWIIPLQKRIYPLAGGQFNEQKNEWSFPSGAVIKNCYMMHKTDWENYASGNNCYQAFDESTMIHEDNYTVTAWNRSEPGLGIKPFRVYASNPGGVSHKKFKREFVDMCPPVKDGGLRWSRYAKMFWQPMKSGDPVWVEIEYQGIVKKIKRQYIPGRLFDNEDLLRENPQYLANLMGLPNQEKVRKLLEGDWSLVEGQFLDMLRRDIHYIKGKELPVHFEKLAAMDYGTTTVSLVGRWDSGFPEYKWITNEWTAVGQNRTEKAIGYKNFLIERGLWGDGQKSEILTVGDSNMFYTEAEREVKLTAAKVFQAVGVRLERVSKVSPDSRRYRLYANDVVKDHIAWKMNSKGEFLVKPKMLIMYDRCPRLAETLEELQCDKNNPDDLDQSMDNDHWYDALKMLLTSNKANRKVDRLAGEKAREEMERRKKKVY